MKWLESDQLNVLGISAGDERRDLVAITGGKVAVFAQRGKRDFGGLPAHPTLVPERNPSQSTNFASQT